MGLDMYLTANVCVGNWRHTPQSEKDKYNAIRSALGLNAVALQHVDGQSLDVELTVAYWRKANAIHRWFVQNCQDGKDDGRTVVDIERKQLMELVRLCKEVLDTLETVDGVVKTGTTYYPDGRVVEHTTPGQVVAQAELAAKVLPTQAGFFFGSTDYDDWYLDTLRSTVQQLEAVLSNPAFENWSFSYHASW